MLSLLLLSLFFLGGPGRFVRGEEYFGSIRRLEQCPGLEDLSAEIHKMDMNYIGNNVYIITFNITLMRDLDRPLDMKFEVKKCANEFVPCENYINYTVSDLCSNLLEEDSIPNSMFRMVSIDPKCPIKKGEYTANKSEINIHPDLLEAGTSANYWKFNVHLVQGEKSVLCLYVEGKVAKVTKVKKKKTRN